MCGQQKPIASSHQGASVLYIILTLMIYFGREIEAKVNKRTFHLETLGSRRQNPKSVLFTDFIPNIMKEEDAPEPSFPANYNSNNALELAEKTVVQYLSSLNNANKRKQVVGKFHLHGWRWHNMSLIRETEKLCKVAQFYKKSPLSIDERSIANLKDAVDYVVDFNLKKLTRLENEVLMPFLRQQFDEHNAVKSSMNTIIDQLETERQILSKLGQQLSSELSKPSTSAVKESQVRDDVDMDDIIQKSNEIIVLAESMWERKNNVVIPAITQLVPERKQKEVSSKVLSTLGVLDLRSHLVGFHEAIKDNERELRLWKENIPLVARKAIHVWKKTQYDPRTFALQRV